MADPIVSISWGELFDKISILEIKRTRIESSASRAAAVVQLDRLQDAARLAPMTPRLRELCAQLKAINERLWTLEDDLRANEAQQAFDERFIAMARGVYHNNDERTRIKRAIDELLGSELTEQKQYSAYGDGKKG
jgi:hypothetical protein